MTDFLKNISLLKKTLFFSFFISFFVVAIIALFSYYLQSYQLEKQLADHALDVSSLWSKTINPKDVEAVKKTQNESDPHFIAFGFQCIYF